MGREFNNRFLFNKRTKGDDSNTGGDILPRQIYRVCYGNLVVQ